MATVETGLIGKLLAGEVELPWRTPRLRALADVLPAAAERSRVPGTVEADWSWAALQTVVWPEALEHAVEREPGWEELAGALVACAEVLATRAPGGDEAWPLSPRRRFDTEGDAPPVLHWPQEWRNLLEQVTPSLPLAPDLRAVAAAETRFEALRRPQIHALLRGYQPCRVLFAQPRPHPNYEPAGASEVRDHLSRMGLAGVDAGWWLRVPSEGRSAMAAMALRAIAEAHPSALRALGDVGITGELDAAGALLPVAALREKVHTFFAHYPEGTCFVPWAQQAELDGLRPEGFGLSETYTRRRDPSRLTPRAWSRVVPVVSVAHLLALLGVTAGDEPTLLILGRVRDGSATVQDWRGRVRAASALAELPLRRRADMTHEDRRFHTLAIDGLAIAPWGEDDAAPPEHRLVVTGRPGSGKSMVMRQLHFALNAGEQRHRGPSLLLPARRLVNGTSLAAALAADLELPLDSIEGLLTDRALAPALWLLLDGLDELPLADRRRAVNMLDHWPGPAVVATRGLPEQLPPGDVIVVQDLGPRELREFLEAEGRADLAPERTFRARRNRFLGDPLSTLKEELSKTPLGASLLAMVWKGTPGSRQELLRDAVLHLVRRAEAEGRLSTLARRRFDRQGLRVLGGAAWRMLREGRAILRVEDLDHAERAAGLSPGEGDLLHEAVEHGGFVQPVGPGHWEFSHKSFAELAAAQHLVATHYAQPWAPALMALGDPGANEVLLHVSVLVEDQGPLLDALLSRHDRWLSSLCLATRVLLEVAPGSVDPAQLLAVVRSRLRLWCALPNQPLPGGLGPLADVQRAMERHREALMGTFDVVLDACPDQLRPWALDPEGEQAKVDLAREARWAARDYSEPEGAVADELVQLGRWLSAFFHPPELSVHELLQSADGQGQLRGRKCGDWLNALPPLFDQVGVGGAARDLWWDGANVGVEIRRLGKSPKSHPHRDAFLGLLAERGSPGQRREALLRLCLPAGCGGRPEDPLVSGLADLGADQVLALWEPAWRSGLLATPWTARRKDSPGLERLWASFIDEDLSPARWRALVALGALHPAKKPQYSWREEESTGRTLPPTLVRRLTALVSDPEPAVAGEALGLLTEAGTRLPWPVLLPVLCGRGPELRIVAVRAALVGRPMLPTVQLVHLVAVDFEVPGDEQLNYERRERGPELPWVAALGKRAATARTGVEKHLRGCLGTWSNARPFFALGDQPHLRPLVDALASGDSRSHNDKAPQTVLRKALASRHPAARLWALRQNGMGRSPVCSEEDLARLSSDPDPAVAEKAQELLKYLHPSFGLQVPIDEDQHPAQGVSETSGPAPLHEGALFAPMGGLIGRPRGATVSVETIRQTQTFKEAWELLGRAGLETLAWNEVDNAGHGDAVEYLEHFMGLAASHNREVVRGAFEHLMKLYTPDWRGALIDALGHPSKGLLAQALLSREPVGRDLLRAIPTHVDAARRVAELAQGTPLALPAVDALVAGLASGALVVDSGETEWGGYTRPEPIRTLARLGRREGLLRLLVAAEKELLQEHALRSLLDERWAVEGPVSDGTATAARRWTLDKIDGVTVRGRLLELLSLCGTPSDVAEWRQRADNSDLRPEELVGVATLVGKCGSIDDTPWLRGLALETKHAAVVGAVFEALAELGGAENVSWMMDRLDDPPPAIADSRSRAEAWEANRKSRWERERALRDAAREAGNDRWFELRLDEPEPERPETLQVRTDWQRSAHKAIVLYGNNAQGLALALREARQMSLVELGTKYGRMPAHALFILGLAANDPGEHVVPASMTGGGDEVMGSGHPERIRRYVKLIVQRTSREGVRQAFLEAMLLGLGSWGDNESSGVIEQEFRALGGPQPQDLGRLLRHLSRYPTSPVGLEYLNRIGLGEPELLAIWREHKAPWLPEH